MICAFLRQNWGSGSPVACSYVRRAKKRRDLLRYLTLSADYSEPGLRDDFQGPIAPEQIGLPPEIGDQIRNWNDRYQEIILLGPQERAKGSTAQLIDSLDHEGLVLVDAIAAALGDVKVRYFSEGYLRYIP